MRENKFKVLAPKQNLDNNREKGSKITVSKSCLSACRSTEGVNRK